MSMQLKSVDFQGKPIYYVSNGGINYVLIRTLCKALQVDADWQIRELKSDEVLSGEVCEHTTRLPDEDRNRTYVCLPEEYIYGFIFGIKLSNTMSDETKSLLTSYKRECYDVLYQHFHKRALTLSESLKEKAHVEIEIRNLRKILLSENDLFRRYDELLTIRQQLSYRLSQNQKAQLNMFVELLED